MLQVVTRQDSFGQHETAGSGPLTHCFFCCCYSLISAFNTVLDKLESGEGDPLTISVYSKLCPLVFFSPFDSLTMTSLCFLSPPTRDPVRCFSICMRPHCIFAVAVAKMHHYTFSITVLSDHVRWPYNVCWQGKGNCNTLGQ